MKRCLRVGYNMSCWNRIIRQLIILPLIMVVLGISNLFSQVETSNDTFLLKGKVYDTSGLPIQNADVSIKNTFIGTLSNSEGSFEIKATSEDVLVISAFLMNSKEINIVSKELLNVFLEPNAQLLDDILLKQKNEREESMATPFQSVKRKALGYPVGKIESSDFWSGDINIYESIRRFPYVQNSNGGPLRFQRSQGQINPSNALVIMDGAPVDQSILQQLDPDLIHSISMVRSLAGTIKYGSLASGGVIYVRTKLAANFDESNGIRKRSALIKNNEYIDKTVSFDESINESKFIEELKSASSFDQAKTIYERHSNSLGVSTMSYFIEASNYFTKWDQVYSHSVLSRLFSLSDNNPKVLLGIAFQCEQLGRFRQAAYVYQELMLLRPDHIQSYLDLAQIYTQIGNYKLANTLYKQMLYNTISYMDFSPVEQIVIAEYRRFLSKFRAKVNFQGLPNDLLVANTRKDVRIVFEWTNPLTEFEIQFVSPERKFYNWRHSAFDSKSSIEQELSRGFAIKDFLIEDSKRGDWIVNINRIGEDNENVPTFVKYTLYKNYGLHNESVEIKVIPLNKINEKVTLDSFLD